MELVSTLRALPFLGPARKPDHYARFFNQDGARYLQACESSDPLKSHSILRNLPLLASVSMLRDLLVGALLPGGSEWRGGQRVENWLA